VTLHRIRPKVAVRAGVVTQRDRSHSDVAASP
jgi:hypothetical protein